MADTSLKTQLVIETQAEHSERLGLVQDALRELASIAGEGGVEFAALAKEFERLAQQGEVFKKLESIGQQGAAIEAVRQLSEAVAETTARLDGATRKNLWFRRS